MDHKDPYTRMGKFYEIGGVLSAAENEEETFFMRFIPDSLEVCRAFPVSGAMT
jgi:hypothetical protein